MYSSKLLICFFRQYFRQQIFSANNNQTRGDVNCSINPNFLSKWYNQTVAYQLHQISWWPHIWLKKLLKMILLYFINSIFSSCSLPSRKLFSPYFIQLYSWLYFSYDAYVFMEHPHLRSIYLLNVNVLTNQHFTNTTTLSYNHHFILEYN